MNGSGVDRRTFGAGALASALLSPAARGASVPARGFRAIDVDAGQAAGTIKDLQGVNRGPAADWRYADLTRQYRDMRVSLVRTHDFYGAFDIDSVYRRRSDPQLVGDAVPIDTLGSIFPDPHADPADPRSYRFGASDAAMAAILKAGALPYFRVGRSAGADTTPPDPVRFAEVVRHVVRHYTAGWAGGMRIPIRYWEIWNEPDFATPFWGRTPDQFHQLYLRVARAIKAESPHALVGGPGLAWSVHEGPYRTAFVRWCAANGAPLDFLSWHSYTNASTDPQDLATIARGIRAMLDGNGFPRAESHVTEWAYGAGVEAPSPMTDAAYRAAGLAYMQDAPVDRAMLYHGQALFEPSGAPRKAARAFAATGMMLDVPDRVRVAGADLKGLAVLAGRSPDRRRLRILVANYETVQESPVKGPPSVPPGLPADLAAYLRSFLGDIPRDAGLPFRPHRYDDNGGYRLAVRNFGWGGGPFIVTRRRLDADRDLSVVETIRGAGDQMRLDRPMAAPSVEVVDVERA